jgi:4-hydroxy-tetrahydrodipicolinate reductase
MKIALLGSGKTGCYVAKLHQNTTVFNSKNIPTSDKLKNHDVIISFLTGEVFLSYLPLILESQIPLICASTGFNWPSHIHEALVKQKTRWCYASNFSLGIYLTKKLIEQMKLAEKIFPEYRYKIEDVHHIHKKDSPSGTALSLQSWLGTECEIDAKREGDVVGYHSVQLQTPNETIAITHNALNRSIFAEGAIIAAIQIINNYSIPYGLSHFYDLLETHLNLGEVS